MVAQCIILLLAINSMTVIGYATPQSSTIAIHPIIENNSEYHIDYESMKINPINRNKVKLNNVTLISHTNSINVDNAASFLEPESIGSHDYNKIIHKNVKIEEKNDNGDHHEPENKIKKYEKDGAEQSRKNYHESEEEEDKMAHESYHGHEKNEKGHHDKESHDKNYDEKKGKEKNYLDDSKYHKHYESGEKNEKDAKFKEEGKFSKGHSTKGDHVIHKKDEYEKLVEFYDESHEADGNMEDSEFYHEFDEMHGSSEKSGHTEKYGEIEKHGKKREYENGHDYDEKKGYDSKNGREKHHDEEEEYGKKNENEKGKRWMYEQ